MLTRNVSATPRSRAPRHRSRSRRSEKRNLFETDDQQSTRCTQVRLATPCADREFCLFMSSCHRRRSEREYGHCCVTRLNDESSRVSYCDCEHACWHVPSPNHRCLDGSIASPESRMPYTQTGARLLRRAMVSRIDSFRRPRYVRDSCFYL